MAKNTVLITGGAGYIGSHAVRAFQEAGYPVVVVDDLSTGNAAMVPSEVPLIEGDAGDAALVSKVLSEHGVGAVVHFAGSIVVPESVVDPLKYYRNNTGVSRDLIETCVTAGVERFVFSSTAAVYGDPQTLPILETSPTVPVSPYGTSKLMTEWVLRDTAAATKLRYVALRYFNVAGADPEGRCGQVVKNATHLIKVGCEAALGRRPFMEIYGEDYDTPDGTCIRDFIHVSDLAAAHVAALEHLDSGENLIMNCGYGHGFSVREVLDTLAKVHGAPLDVRSGPRRPGDSVVVVADVSRLRSTLTWQPKYDDLEFIVRTALDWEAKL